MNENKFGIIYSNTDFREIAKLKISESSFDYQKPENDLNVTLILINIQGVNENLTNSSKIQLNDQTLYQIKSKIPNFSNDFNSFSILPAINLSLFSNIIKKPFRKPIILEIYMKNIKNLEKICLGKLNLNENIWECTSNSIKTNGFYYSFQINNDGIYAAILNPSTFLIENNEDCLGIECKSPLLLAGIVLASLFFILIIAYCIRVICL